MDKLSPVLGAVAHPIRRAILERLRNGPARVTEIAAPFSLSLNAVSKHLKVLEASGLVRRRRQGREHILELDGAPLSAVVAWAHPYERFWNSQLDALERHFKPKKEGKS